ncbi:hypothetical protein C8F04DRAFT_1104345 [Mycena alexandri]|uniref:Uncharacterized protein n=1 Tax=Mycena alexandri TaxID=1745969 RepID=A0AAD6ST49_9AGAR|nr:hypothetical protein C8F04DRAFT_1104345 [Mycena alexandri]
MVEAAVAAGRSLAFTGLATSSTSSSSSSLLITTTSRSAVRPLLLLPGLRLPLVVEAAARAVGWRNGVAAAAAAGTSRKLSAIARARSASSSESMVPNFSQFFFIFQTFSWCGLRVPSTSASHLRTNTTRGFSKKKKNPIAGIQLRASRLPSG